MQEIKSSLFIESISEEQIQVISFNENNEILQYKSIELSASKLNNIYCGIIEKIDYSIESFFLKIGDNLFGFLPFKNLNELYYCKEKGLFHKNLKKGDKLIVQVIRDSLEKKLLKLTNIIALSGSFCTYFPNLESMNGISSNIKGDKRVEFKEFLKSLNLKGSVIIRTTSFNLNCEDINLELIYLKKFWTKLSKSFKSLNTFKLLYQYDTLLSLLRSYSTFFLKEVLVTSKDILHKIKAYQNKNFLKFPDVKLINSNDVLSKIQSQIDDLYKFKVDLPSNGAIIISKTEAMITIDVNSGKSYNKKGNMECTAFKTNLEAANAVVKQILLRNLGGIIAIDFIDMKNDDHIQAINDIFKQGFKSDKASVKIEYLNSLGVLQVSRERKGLSLIDKFYHKCAACEGGLVQSDSLLSLKFIRHLSDYSYSENINISVNSTLFNMIFANYYNIVKKYKNLKWKIIEGNDFEIY